MPQFQPPKFFQQQANELKFGALVTPSSFDWDNDGDEDLICGNTAGYIGFIENLDGGSPPRWAAPVYLKADEEIIRIMAGPNGSIQGPCEAKWGYTTLNVADWNHDGLPDIVVNSIWGKVIWYKNIGIRQKPQLASAQPIEVEWPGKSPKPAWTWWEPEGKSLATQWRTTPVMLDHEGYLVLFKRSKQNGKLILLPGERMFSTKTGNPLRMNEDVAGKSGRRKFCFTDWDLDGRLDLMVNSRNVNFLRNVSENKDAHVFSDQGMVSDQILAGHTTSPTVVDWNKDGIGDLLVGAEDGFFYYMKNPHSK
jgi:hypothetical protein